MADPPMRYMDGAAFDFFLIEMVNTLRASSAHAQARARKVEEEMIGAGLLPAPLPAPAVRKYHKDSVASLASKETAKGEDEEEGLRLRLEAIGMHVGANITERCVRLSRWSTIPQSSFLLDCATGNHTFPRRSIASSLFAKISGRCAGISRLITSGRTIGQVSDVYSSVLSSHFGSGCVRAARQFIQTYRSIVFMGGTPGRNQTS